MPPIAIPDYRENTTGEFDPYTWTFSETSAYGNKEAALTIAMEAKH